MRLSVIVPALNEEQALPATLAALAGWRRQGHEVLVVDGGSGDATVAVARAGCDAVLSAPRGRARQMNVGAQAASGEVLCFVHADTLLPAGADAAVTAALAGCVWGRFDVRLSGSAPLLRVVERAINLRSRLTGIATGDQAMFVCRHAFAAVGGFPEQPLMEDIELSCRLRRAFGRPACLRTTVQTSSRRWEQRGIVRTILTMWTLRAAYALGVGAQRLAAWYT